MNRKTTSVCFGRARLPHWLAGQLMALPRGVRGRTVAFVMLAHSSGLDVQKMVEAAAEMRRLGVLLNQSLRVSRGTSANLQAVELAVRLIGGMFP